MESNRSIKAKDLYDSLNPDDFFESWIKKEASNFNEGDDYLITYDKGKGKDLYSEYHLSLEMADKISSLYQSPQKELMIKQFEANDIRIVDIDGNLWFVAKDICDSLGLKNVSMVLQNLDEEERSKYYLGRQGETNIINESGMYSIVLQSRKPESKKFKKWITSEVIPSIRKTGSYSVTNPLLLPNFNDPVAAARAWADAKEAELKAQLELKKQEPLVHIANEFLNVPDSLKGTDEIAKELGIGEITLFRILREKRFFHYIRQNGQKVNVPYQIHIDAGRVVVKNKITNTNHQNEEKKMNYSRSYFTPKGEAYVCNILKEWKEKMK